MWEKNPVVFLVLATLTILVGTIITTALPFLWVNTEADRIETVRPYTPLELEGRDVYIREGCNNCHTQTVRPLVAEVLRYGDYSRSGEFVYDRPHLWGSRRAGPDLARIGGKYPDAWHVQHMAMPTALVPRSNMPAYAFLADRKIDSALTRKKMQALDFPYEAEQIEVLQGASEMDAMVAYLQMLGTGLPRVAVQATSSPVDLVNPSPGDAGAVAEGAQIYQQNCAACHGQNLEGGIGPDLPAMAMLDGDLHRLISEGIPDGGMPAFASLGAARIWKLVNFINYRPRP
jgi:cytochrome c oxidase cbb3-type subunit II